VIASNLSVQLALALKVAMIGVVFVASLGASFLVGKVANDRIKYQNEALQNQSGNKTAVLIFGNQPGFDTETGISVYRPVDRVIKYSILFITLTFLAFFLLEVIYQLKLHPVQYLLVGLGLAEFYLLLLALMEHIGFLWAYIIAAVMTIGLISLYSHFILKTKMGSVMIAILLAIIYSYMLVVLHLETFALLAGSLLLFALLSLVMFVTRNLNWYKALNYAARTE